MSRNLPARPIDATLPESINHRLNLYSAAAAAAGVSRLALAQPAEDSISANHARRQDGIDRRLHLYSVAAMAAGVGMLALAQPVEGKIVATKTNLPINATVSLSPPTFIDFNHDGIADVQFSRYSFGSGGFLEADLKGRPESGGGLVGTSRHTYRDLGYGSALKRGARIGPSAHFVDRLPHESNRVVLERSTAKSGRDGIYSQHFYGKWGVNQPSRFVGVKFLIDGATHYGWVRVAITSKPGQLISGTITEYAYETIANKRIPAGVVTGSSVDTQAGKEIEPGGASLGMLAFGVDGLALWRREEAPNSD
jgi:hypothetical protein